MWPQAELILITAGKNGPPGVLRAGTKGAPFPGVATIQLNGNFGSPTYAMSEDRDAGNMAIVVLGQVGPDRVSRSGRVSSLRTLRLFDSRVGKIDSVNDLFPFFRSGRPPLPPLHCGKSYRNAFRVAFT